MRGSQTTNAVPTECSPYKADYGNEPRFRRILQFPYQQAR
jgi:hypothetical protein